MAAPVRVVIFNAEEEYGATLRAALLSFDGVKILAELDEAALIPESATRFPADVLVANLDPAPEVVLHMLGEAAKANPELQIFAVSSVDPSSMTIMSMLDTFSSSLARVLPICTCSLYAGIMITAAIF